MLPAHAIRNDVASLDDVANMLADHAMLARASRNGKDKTADYSDMNDQFHINELMEYIPRFQFGMDVNPKFTGCQAYEYTPEVAVFDMLACGRLLHGWLVDPVNDEHTAIAIGSKTYNELMDQLIMGQDAEAQISKLQSEIDQFKLNNIQLMDENIATLDFLDDSIAAVATGSCPKKLADLVERQKKHEKVATQCHLIQHFLQESCHQLTVHGLELLHSTLIDDEMCVFFRNNHYSTMTKHNEQLFMLVTDLGYANTGIVWEKLGTPQSNNLVNQ